jgi:hypothetical protein
LANWSTSAKWKFTSGFCVQNGLKVSDTGYFVYTNGRLDLDGFYNKIEFKTKLIAYQGDDSWVEPAIH